MLALVTPPPRAPIYAEVHSFILSSFLRMICAKSGCASGVGLSFLRSSACHAPFVAQAAPSTRPYPLLRACMPHTLKGDGAARELPGALEALRRGPQGRVRRHLRQGTHVVAVEYGIIEAEDTALTGLLACSLLDAGPSRGPRHCARPTAAMGGWPRRRHLRASAGTGDRWAASVALAAVERNLLLTCQYCHWH